MYKKRPVNSFEELKKLRPGSDFQIENYKSVDSDKLPHIENLDKAVTTIVINLVDTNIVVYTDYDVDGVMSASIVVKLLALLTRLYARFTNKTPSAINLLVPDRMKDGYGFNVAAAEQIHNSLVLLLDNGIVQHEAIDVAKANNNTVVVLDHHSPDEKLPNADVIVNPNAIPGGQFNEYCAAGICYRLARQMLTIEAVKNAVPANILHDALEEFNFLAAVATIADVVPLLNENRMIVKNGLRNIPESWRPFVNYLCETSEDRDHVWGDEIRFKVAPAINATGRLGELTPQFILAMCLNKDGQRDTVAKHILRQNQRRRADTAEAISIINTCLEKDKTVEKHNAVIINSEAPIGVIGIVAGKLADKYQKPCFVFSKNEAGELVGSARTKSGTVNLKELLDKISKSIPSVIIRHGGHELAAGVTVSESGFDKFKEAVFNIVDNIEYHPDTDEFYDFEIKPSGNWFDAFSELEENGPWGEGNPAPVYMVELDVSSMKKKIFKETIRIMDNELHEYLGFGMKAQIEGADKLRLIGNISRNEYHGGDRMQFTITAIEPVYEQTTMAV